MDGVSDQPYAVVGLGDDGRACPLGGLEHGVGLMTDRPDPLPDGWILCALPTDGGRSRFLPHAATTDPSWGSGLQCGTCLRHVDGHDEAVAERFRAYVQNGFAQAFVRNAEADGDHAWLAAYHAAKEALADPSDRGR